MVAGDAGMTWWTAGLLVLAALRAALIEEVIVVGHLAIRLRALGERQALANCSSATKMAVTQ